MTEKEEYDALVVAVMHASEIAGGLRKSREASLVVTKLDEARLWLEEYGRKNFLHT